MTAAREQNRKKVEAALEDIGMVELAIADFTAKLPTLERKLADAVGTIRKVMNPSQEESTDA